MIPIAYFSFNILLYVIHVRLACTPKLIMFIPVISILDLLSQSRNANALVRVLLILTFAPGTAITLVESRPIDNSLFRAISANELELLTILLFPSSSDISYSELDGKRRI